MRPPAQRHPGYMALAEVAMVGVSGAVLYSFVRMFGDLAYLPSLLAVVVFSHAVTILMRRTGVGLATTALVSVIGFAFLSAWLWFPRTTAALLPTPDTWHELTASLRGSWSSFAQITPPIPAEAGFLFIAGAALFCAIFLADWAAFRLWSPVEAVVGYFALYMFGVLLGDQSQQVGTAVAFAASVGLFLLACRALRLASESGWLAPGRGRAVGWLGGIGVPAVLIAVVVGTLLGPELPGTEGALVDWRQNQEASNRIVISPLVQIEDRLVQQSELEAFTVESTQPAYWRLTALDTFDGDIWRSGGRYGEADGSLGATVPEEVGADQVEQVFHVTNLGATWLPAAYQPVAVEVEGTAVRYQDSSSTLIVDNDVLSSDDLTYRVASRVPRPTAEQLGRPELDVPDDLSNQLALPDSLSDQVRSLADEVVERSGASTPYERALALQSFFRDEGVFADDDHEFTYVLGPGPEGHSGDAMVDFLASGQGYCEQFSGTYAAMARVLGLPARVAVGFTWGDPDPEQPGRYVVRGRHAHAWPEVWMGEDVGWIAFEPTPGRGSPTMGDYAGVEASQASSLGGLTSEPLDEELQPLPTDPSLDPSQTPPEEVSPPSVEDPAGSVVGEASDTPGWPAALALAGLAALVVVGLYALGMPALLSWARKKRRSGVAEDPAARVRLAWEESEESLAIVGIARRKSETHEELARRAALVLTSRADELAELAEAGEAASYAPHPPSTLVAERAEQAADSLAVEAQGAISAQRRLIARLDPRPAWTNFLAALRSR